MVSSTVGASLVLGPLLWSPAGKVVLALVFTATFSGLGVGLVRWGAERAGRMMLAASLIVIPINLMLLGELRLMADPSGWEVGLVGLDAALLFLLARAIVSAPGFPSGGTFTAAFFGLAAFDAGAYRGMSAGAGLVVFLAPGAIFLGAVAWLVSRLKPRGGADEGLLRLDHAYLEFGLLAFAYLSGVLRTGAAVLQLAPSLYAIPAILAAIAGVSTARAIEPIEKVRKHVLLFLQGGLVLSSLAFALALARPLEASALHSGDTLAVAVLGLALYATSLRATRKPVYLYCGFAALFLAYFGAFDFAKDLVRSVEEAARQAMGYDRPLPAPFRAINGLAFNAGLALLSRFFAREWSDDRLAWHCHAIGLPLSVAACVFSGFEPKAALICMGGYAALYAAGTRMFAEPRLIYLACAASAGAASFGASMTGGATLGLRSTIASVLGLAFWAIRATPALKRAGEAYRTPLIRSSRVMAALAMASASAASIQDGMIAPLATLAFLLTATLALLNGHESPRVSVYLLAIGALLGTWLGGFHLLNGGELTTAMVYGLMIAGFAVALLAAGEASRAWLGGSEPTRAYLGAMALAVPVVVFLAWGLAGWDGELGVPVARAFLVGSSALLWLTRFRREPSLVYLGLAGLSAWTACLRGLVVPGDPPEMLLGWLAITSGGGSLALWGAGEWARRRGDSFYSHPCFVVAGVLAAGASVGAIEARWVSADSYRLGVAAMLAGSASFGLIAGSRRWPSAVGLAVGSSVGASYLALLSQGPASPDSAWVLAAVAASEAIAARGAGLAVRRLSGDPGSTLARPLDFWALALMLASIPMGYSSPATMLLVAAASMLMVGCFPTAAWLYGTSLAIGSAIYHQWLRGLSGDGSIPFVVLGAYAAWGVGVALQRSGPTIRGRLGLAALAFEGPPVRVALALGVLSAMIRFRAIAEQGAGWARLPWLPWALAGLSLLMLRFDPRRGWVHAAVGLTGLGFLATAGPLIGPGGWWLSGGMALAGSWSLAGWGVGRVEGTFRRRLGISEGDDSAILHDWALGAFSLVGMVMAWVVIGTTFLSIEGGAVRWWDLAMALGLAVVVVGSEGRRSGLDAIVIGLETIGPLAAWWLAAPESPLVGRWIDPSAYLPLATSAGALVVVLIGRRFESRRESGVVDPSEAIETTRSPLLVGFTSWYGFGLGLASIDFDPWASDRVALLALLLASTALGDLALGWRRVESAYAGGLTWCLAGAVGLLLAVRT